VTPVSHRGNGPRERSAGRHAEHGKVTICHATGSDTNPYVQITISRNALKAHARHQDGRDILSVPPGGCPGGVGSSALAGGPAKASICHATGSLTNPFVLITVAFSAVLAHERHHGDADIVNPQGPCPGGNVAEGGVAGVYAASGKRLRIADGTMSGPSSEAAGTGGVKGVSASSPGSAKPAAARSGGSGSEGPGGSLPFTGVDLLAVVLIGTLSLLAGWRIRKAAASRS
jgi:hypothetical protein